MMDKELIKALKLIEKEFDVNLFTFDEALEFYKSDVEEYKSFVNQSINLIQQERKDEELSANELGYIEGLKLGIKVVEMIFGGRIEEGF